MNVLILLFLTTTTICLVLGTSQMKMKKEFDKEGSISVNMNDYLDELMKSVGPWLVANGMDPMSLPDMHEHFEAKPVLITYKGDIFLTNGAISNIRNVSRSGDATIQYDKKLLRVTVGAALKSLNFKFDYKARVMDLGLGPNGWLDGKVKHIKISSDFLIDITDFFIYMQDFRVVDIGDIDVKVRGNILIDWLSNIIIKVVTILFRTQITDYVSGTVKDFVQKTIDDINNQDIGLRKERFLTMVPEFLIN